MALTGAQRAYAEQAIAQAVEKFLDELNTVRPLSGNGEECTLKISASFGTDPNMPVWGEPKTRDELGQYLHLSIEKATTTDA